MENKHRKEKIEAIYKMANELKKHGIFYKKFKFTCYFDHLFNFEYKTKTHYFQLSIICDNDIMARESFRDLANARGLFYIDLDISLIGDFNNKSFELTYTKVDDKSKIIKTKEEINGTR